MEKVRQTLLIYLFWGIVNRYAKAYLFELSIKYPNRGRPQTDHDRHGGRLHSLRKGLSYFSLTLYTELPDNAIIWNSNGKNKRQVKLATIFG